MFSDFVITSSFLINEFWIDLQFSLYLNSFGTNIVKFLLPKYIGPIDLIENLGLVEY